MREMLDGRAPAVGPMVLGSLLTTSIGGHETTVVITEVEAYTQDDPASHSFRGGTPSNASMFALAGTLYVYRSYGVHWCMNIVTGPVGVGEALLIRAGVPVTRREVMVQRRGRSDRISDGPGKLAQALGVDGSHDGLDLLGNGPVTLRPGDPLPHHATGRIGISKAVDRPWRWVAEAPVTSPGSEEHPPIDRIPDER